MKIKKMSIKKYLFLISLIFLCAGLSQTILINEVMSANSTTIADEDGDYSDWIELYNAGETSANLGGVGLSDDPDDLFKWVLPDIQIGPDSHLLIFASDKDRSAISSHWETVINWGDDWKYFIGYSAPPSSWRELDFEDNNWPEGPSGFGYGDGDDATIVQPVISVFIRNTFTIESTDVVEQAILHVDYDDAFVAYLNGVEIARANIGTPGVVPNYNQGSDTWREAQIYAGGLPDVFPVNLEQAALLEGNNVLAIEVHNYEASSSDMSLIPFFTLGMSEIPADPNGSPELLNLQLSPLHTNFKIQSAGEAIYLTAPDEQRLDSLYTSDQPSDISFGRSPDGSENLLLFPNPTPGYENALSGFAGIVPAPEASLTAGFYDSTVSVSLSCPSPSADIHFTLDGSDPTEQSPAYQGSLYFNDTTVLKSRAFETNHLPSPIVTNTYFVQDNSELTVISLSTDPDNLWDYNYGIYVMGPNASPSFPHFGANFWEDWERPIHMELFEPDGSLAFSTGAGVKIFGGWSRGLPQKSLALYARGEYGASAFEYAFFENRPFDSYQALVLRNSGNDWESSMMRDGMMTSLIDNEDVDLQAYRPAAVYINGDYWGIHNIREKINEHFVAAHHDVDPDDIDLLENNGSPIHGDASNYNSLINFLNNEDITLDENYDYVKTLLDINSYVSYQAVQIYFDNQDWPGNNNKFWRPRTEDGKWRWLLYDTDFGFGIWNPNAFTNNTLEYALDPYGPGWPNPPWSTF
ncbi:MAG: CotH kinase family protein, partial [FCB group bacterium]|nr:CotH kinase family protein [FCB group bacterium]